MKTLIIYASIHHGNTEKIARVIADYLNAGMAKVNDVDVNAINGYDLIGFGSGIYHSKPHKKIIDLVEELPDMSCKKAFVFSTSGLGKNEYNNPVKQQLEHKGFEVIGSFTCKGYDTYGPFKFIGGIAKGRPNEGDFRKAQTFAQGIYKLFKPS